MEINSLSCGLEYKMSTRKRHYMFQLNSPSSDVLNVKKIVVPNTHSGTEKTTLTSTHEKDEN
jgi:hypothetical protein